MITLKDAGGMLFKLATSLGGTDGDEHQIVTTGGSGDGSGGGGIVFPYSQYVGSRLVGLTPVRLTGGDDIPAATACLLKADPTNTGIIYLGTWSGLTVPNGPGLAAGDLFPIEIARLMDIWLVATLEAQRIGFWCGTPEFG